MKQLRQVLFLIHHHNPSILPTALLEALVKALRPFLSLILSAQILDCLLEENYTRAAYLAAAMLLSLFLSGILQDVLRLQVKKYTDDLFYLSYLKMYDRSLALDYASISTHETQESLRMAKEAVRQRGGLGRIMEMAGEVASCLITVLTTFGMVLHLCIQPPSGERLARLASWQVTVGVLLLTLTALMLANFHARKKDRQTRTEHL